MVAGMWSRVTQVTATVTAPVRQVWSNIDAWWARVLPGWRGEVASFGLWILFFFFIMPTFLWQPFHIPSRSMENTLLTGDYLFVSKYSYGYSRYSMYPWQLLNFDGRVWAGLPQMGDVVVFKLPGDPSQDYIKRIVGLPGDRVQVKRGVLYINGNSVTLNRLEDWDERDETVTLRADGTHAEIKVNQIQEVLPNGRKHIVLDRNLDDPSVPEPPPSPDNTVEYQVPPGHYFVMGDNRDMSADSRVPGSGVGFVPFENIVGRADLIFFSVSADLRWWQVWRWPFAIRYDRLITVIR